MVVVNDTVGALLQPVEAGETFDVAVLTPEVFVWSGKAAKVVPVSAVLHAQVGIGAAAREGAPVPEVGTVAAFTQALLAAHSVASVNPASGGTSRICLAGLFNQLGIADRIRPKAVMVPGGLVSTRGVIPSPSTTPAQGARSASRT